jgi:hypothetical protein
LLLLSALWNITEQQPQQQGQYIEGKINGDGVMTWIKGNVYGG